MSVNTGWGWGCAAGLAPALLERPYCAGALTVRAGTAAVVAGRFRTAAVPLRPWGLTLGLAG
nr:hypothetical protein RSP673_21825 [Ralstonia solanacearum P673]